jgi:hypothetical protein
MLAGVALEDAVRASLQRCCRHGPGCRAGCCECDDAADHVIVALDLEGLVELLAEAEPSLPHADRCLGDETDEVSCEPTCLRLRLAAWRDQLLEDA